MANNKARLARLTCALVLAAMGVACAPTALPLPMLAAGHRPAHASADHAITPGGESAAASASAR
jgi:hypothetical protein